MSEIESMASIRARLRKDSREQAEAIFKLAGFTWTHVWELANGYWPDAAEYDYTRRPWWLFATSIGPIRIGWRKRVLEIDWKATGVECEVTQDDTTKGLTYVHAWSVDHALQYLHALRNAASEAKP